MTYDAVLKIRQGAVRPVYVTINGNGNNLTLQAGPTVTLYSSSGVVVAGFNAVAVTGYDTGSQAAPRLWYVLSTAALAPGTYAAVFTAQAQGADGIVRTFVEDAEIRVLAAVEIVATYDLTTPVGQARNHAGDTDTSNPTWSDAEFCYYLTMAGNIPQLAAALALEAGAADASKLAIIQKNQSTNTDLTKLPGIMMEAAARLREAAPIPLLVNAPDPVFTTKSGNGTMCGTMDVW